MSQRIVHLVRHGEVDNPDGILYGRMPGYHLSELGRRMADRLADHFAHVPLTALRCSPLERAQETMTPIAARHPGLLVVADNRAIEARSEFEGQKVGVNRATVLHLKNWWLVRNPLQPTWGESYAEIAERMLAVVHGAARAAGDDGQALVVTHQLPIWMARCRAEGRRLWHDPRHRQCTLASVTTFTLLKDRIVEVSYAEPARDLLPAVPAGPDRGSRHALRAARENARRR